MTYMIIPAILSFLSYFFYCYMQYKIGRKTLTANSWMAFIPILNFFHLIMIIGKSIPVFIANCIIMLALWVSCIYFQDMSATPLIQVIAIFYTVILMFIYSMLIIFELPNAVGLSRLFGILLLIPGINLFAFAFLAFCKEGSFSKEVLISWFLIIFLYTAPFLFFQNQIHIMADSFNKFTTQITKTKNPLDFKKMMSDNSKNKEDEILTKDETFYSWKDESGNEHIVSSLNEIPPEYQKDVVQLSTDNMNANLKLMTSKEEGVMLTSLQGLPQPEQLKDRQFNIIIYTFANDPNKIEAENYFKKFNMPYKILDVIKEPENAIILKQKLGLDVNKKYNDILFPVIEIDGKIINPIVSGRNPDGKIVSTELNTKEINKAFGLRGTFE